MMWTMVEIGQHIQKSRCRVVIYPVGMSVDHRI